MRFCRPLAIACALLSTAPAYAQSADDARLTFGVPVYVSHPHDLAGPDDWNEGWFKNEGVLGDISWPVYQMGTATNLRAGFTAGGFDNSFGDASFFLGGMVEIETFATPRLAFSLGTYAGGITGYDTSPAPAIAPYIGTSYALTERFELGARGYWLPAETIAGSDLAPSDAYVAAITVGTRF